MARISNQLNQPNAMATPGRGYRLFKRVMDVTGATIGLILLMPLMLICALWIKIIDPGPAIYTQWRVGHQGWLFRIYKLRTMWLDAEQQGAQFAQADDPRILPGCTWMRKSHVDELPQLVNILLGHMSLVGPRPERPEILEQIRPTLPNIDLRHTALPGLTGMAQVVNGYTNDHQGTRRKLALDLRYIRQRSIGFEIKLLLRTVTKVWDPAAM